ncbi:iron hydrogenase [Gorgonomyces haynaldii]|nr:iron hydrogenase [Gorgonomyces haynaldii]
MTFSPALQITDLNDFIGPSQECIKPVQTKKTKDSAQIAISGEQYFEVTKEGQQKLEAATISLNDCLACSGCVTSAETVLIQMQSHHELTQMIASDKTVVVSLSPQSMASLALKYQTTVEEAFARTNYFLKSILKVDHVFDIHLAKELSLWTSAQEFINRYQSQKMMLSSSCPGWICYCEKTHGDLLEMIDSTKSPQQIMGSLVKQVLRTKLECNPDTIYHVAVMPCYDKKLEASRSDFYNDVYRTRDVDCVITTGELERLFQEQNVQFAELQSLFEPNFFNPTGLLSRTEGTSSGGHLSFVLRHAVRELFQIQLTPQDVADGNNGISIVRGRNQDFTEVFFTPPGHTEPALRFCYAYGFRNIQNIVRKAKLKSRTRKLYDFVEVMACPSGCINGGGQLKTENAEQTRQAEQLYQSLGVTVSRLDEWLQFQDLFKTQYHRVEPLSEGLVAKW